MENWLQRTEFLIGKEAIEKLNKSKIVVLGVGGVGSFVIEALVRSGVGNITIVDNDTIDITNINRQIHANLNTVGKSKVEVMKERILSINPNCNVKIHEEFINKDNISELVAKDTDYVVDAIDTASSKILSIVWCDKNNINIISSMGTANKLHPTKLRIADIYDTKVCPLAKIMRYELRKRNIKSLKVLYSEETPIKNNNRPLNDKGRPTPASIAFVPPCAGLIIAGEVVRDIIK
ncbi:tRNA threonylcarbamoyladenosine dehydratase [Clostridium botulinum]|uniref:THIF-type NAD/FAD binding fold domain-containing protein n=5 Tax=Clostridium TaxID=1485 RepID=A5HXT5_CLOBH|nr:MULTISPECIES: tRNA threonylcarbamoyladenosine dehydratase [Clostridium]EKN36693.1 hesa/MoeB/ThiF family protein [Clostridium botulinum CFSAN001627]EPS47137.1 hesa/MoeB/ThiF family protein related to EC-YgdL [Clostridium botulinum CFSAN002369]EPS47554.1 hesa/MoeB/ThiF family protein related to EC-YgdL [Clostridium botulinum CFSAN002367]KRU27091.1 molybdenum cofactor biosynthesis MoeB [Clostridium sporogenes]ABS35343.1 thiF domain protein [Clostridium botulinum A str. ATCC 19397]